MAKYRTVIVTGDTSSVEKLKSLLGELAHGDEFQELYDEVDSTLADWGNVSLKAVFTLTKEDSYDRPETCTVGQVVG